MTAIPVYFKEMPCAKFKFSDDGKSVEKDFYNLFLPHVQVEIRDDTNCVAVNCFPKNFVDPAIRKEIVKYCIDGKQDDRTRFYFDNVYEGNIHACLPTIHQIIKEAGIPANNCYFITGAMDASVIYKNYCIDLDIQDGDKINIIVLTAWERHIQNSTERGPVQDYKFVVEPKEKLFLCFNRIFRSQRLALLGLMYSRNLVDKGYYSYFPDCTYNSKQKPDINMIFGDLSNELARLILDEYHKHLPEMPLLLNNPDASPTNYVLTSDLDYYRSSYFSIVTETFFFSRNNNKMFDESAVFFSEKIFKPIICKHPFILLGRPRSLYYLRKLGYKTFHPWIDESYDLIENDERRLMAVVDEIERLSKKTTEEWITMLTAIEEVINHNFEVMINKPLCAHIL